MTSTRGRYIIVPGMILALVALVFAQNPAEKYLTAGDVEKVAAMKGVKLIPRGSMAGANGDLNFADASGELILTVQFAEAKNFESYKTKFPKGALAGIGDQAVEGAMIPGMAPNLVAFTKGTRCVALTAFGDFAKMKVYLTIDQLTALAKLVASRM